MWEIFRICIKKSIIDNYFKAIYENFRSLNLLPIGSVIYSVFSLNPDLGSFNYGPYRLAHLSNIITDEDVTLYVDFPTASLMTDGDIFSVANSYLIAKIIGDVAESNKKAWIYSML